MLRNFIKISFLIALSFNQYSALAADVVKMDRIVAVVDQTVITEQELESRITSLSAQLRKQGTELPEESILRKQILERLISDALQLQYAAQTGIKVDDIQLDKTIERIAEQNKMTIREFHDALNQDGISIRKFRADIRNEIIIARLREREVESRVNVSESEIDNYLTTQASSNQNQDEYDISHILIRVPEDAAPEDVQKAKTKVDEALAALDAGTNFAKVSASFSDAPNALEGGNIGWKSGSQVPTLFLDALKTMQKGDVSTALRSPNGFHILKVNDKRGGSSPLIIEQTHARHILIKLSEIMSEKDAKQKIDGIKERLDNGEKFEILARQFSEDGTASNGGDLGWVNPGDTVPQFEKAMNTLKQDEISEPVLSPFGWHVIQVIERRKQDMSKEAARLKARQEIRTRKADEAYQDWVRELRDRAFVELRLEDKF
ncbi:MULTISPECIES: peptidylprolyl isomerase [Methylotenera]|jgi:peptidyl-prolyl cis-trans isomerase SurA|uniref:Chaperone SurA n=1 Tax=Methylotenera mobilis TaxID=359408 RepID=A0A351RCY8_9PROT|nr:MULTISPECIES: peptidylprolyl isomerase [Methylotenera]MDP3212343.1 peptidylprolyl isomerase [Methylotenera sp.]MDP3778331.1 peptidylprolyl isomerase [Methylotenera sp.]PPC96640.1 MAG: molecular chaperone SurA [Methylotenera sp.]HBA09909.1 molecular chaperone SurA [Methylotenera mobilis]